MDSASKISFFFEADAWDEEGQLKQAKELSINKIGHGRFEGPARVHMGKEEVGTHSDELALHDLDPVFSQFCRSQLMKSVIQQIVGIESPHLVQSMYIFKQPRIGGEGRSAHVVMITNQGLRHRGIDGAGVVVGVHQDNWFLRSDPLSCYGLWFALEDSTLENGCLWAVPGSHKGRAIPLLSIGR